jgi:TRAP-type C4-dicarboxylate transport system substrate-binding protein
LDEAEQAVILEAAKMARDVQRGLAPIREAEAFDFLKDQGMVINEIDTSTFREKAVTIQDEIALERDATELLGIIRSVE